jgi:AcrR family transcriptional regulator
MRRDRSPDGSQQPGWRGWQGDPDDLWPGSGSPSTPPGQRSRADDQAHEHVQQPGQRGRDRMRPPLSRAEIVDAAIAIADAEGAEALSMRRIAQVMRAGTMSLYWHVTSKDHLLDLMRDTLMAEVAVPEPSDDWRANLRALAVSNRSMLARHRWLMDFVGGRPPLGPTTLLNLEASLAILAALELEPARQIDILTTVNTYVTGAVLRESQEIRTERAESEARALHSQADLIRDRQAWRDRLLATGLFPHFIRFLDADVDPDAAQTREARFEFGLDCLLDGLAARIDRQ